MKIGILQSAGIAGDIIEKALAEPEINELFTPVIYSKENKNDKNVSSDLKFGNIAAVVVAPGSTTEFKFDGTTTLHLGRRQAVATAITDAEESEVPTLLTAELLTAKLQTLWLAARRDLLLSSPRIAVLAYNTPESDLEKDVIRPVINEQTEAGLGIFGPYDIEDFENESLHKSFDIILAISDSQAERMIPMVADEVHTRFICGLPIVMTQSDFAPDYDFAENIDAAEEGLLKAIYSAIDIRRNRDAYDIANANPLQKLYHERRDDSEKIRFAISKKKEG